MISQAVVRGAAPLGKELKAVIDAISQYAVIDPELRDKLWADSEKAAAN